jgi:vancomycin resistance protein YoaR
VIGEILSVSGAEGRTGAVTDVPPDPSEPVPTDLLDFPPLPKQPGRRGGEEPGYGFPEVPTQGTDYGGSGPAEPESADEDGIRIVPDAEATARLRIMLPAQPPTPSTALRPQPVWEDTHATDEPSAAPFLEIAASPASPSTLPSQLAAMTTATMVIPLPPSVRPGSGLLTTTLPPDQAAQANAAQIGEAFRDTIEEIFGVDFDTVDPAELGLPPRRAEAAPIPVEPGYDYDYPRSGYADSDSDSDHPDYPESGYGAEGDYGVGAEPGYGAPDTALAPIPFPRPVPAEVFGGAYGVPTAQAPFGGVPVDPFGNQRAIADPNRHALALRYLGGIFHDSSGESSYLDPEDLDQGWIPSAFGAVPPDAPTVQMARIPADLPLAASARPAPPAAPVRPRPVPVHSSGEPEVAVTSVLPAQQAPAPPHGRAGSRGGPRSDRPRHGSGSGSTPEQPVIGRGRRGKALTVAGLVVAAIALLYGIALLVSGGVLSGTVPAGMSVDGVSIGGLSQDAARQAVTAQLGPLSTRAIELEVGQTPVELDPAKSGLSLDVVQTVAAAEAERTNPFTVISALFGMHHQVNPVVDVNQSELTGVLSGLAASYDTPMVEGKITFTDGQPVVTQPQQGRGFGVATAVSAISTGYLQVPGPIVLPDDALTPLATPGALQNALAQIARPAVSAPITLVTGTVSTVLTPTQIGDALTIAPNKTGTMVPTLDGALLRADLNPAALATEQPGTNASFTVVAGIPQLIPERDGVGYPPQALASAVGGVLTTTAPRSATLQQGPLPPAFTTADAEALDVQAVIGSATIPIPEATDRTADTERVTSLVMGSVVQPGAVWSFDKAVGAPTAANGFTEPADAVSDGVDASGAADLVATAVFDAAFRAGMGDTVHHPNAAYFSRYPVGLDAAVVWPGTDLQWTDSGSHPVYLYAAYANDSLTVSLLGQSAYDQVSVNVSGRQDVVTPTAEPGYGCPAQPAADGFQVNVTRVLTKDGAQVGTEQFHVTYAPFAGTTCGSTATQGTEPTSGTPAGSSSAAQPTAAPTTASSNPGGGSSTGGNSPAPPAPSSPAPTSSSGVLGGLLH